ncbi:hypothetical protein J7L68_07465, partial [bacterium]|nr:hypothetical protein [bacterium]
MKDYLKVEGKKMKINEMNNFERNKTKNQPEQKEEHRKKYMREEELKNKIAEKYFSGYDTTRIIGNIDFCVIKRKSKKELSEQESLLWAEAKRGKADYYESIVQLILTIGKARTFDDFLPPPLLGAFDEEKIAFIPYSEIHEVFYINDFNWNVTPSDHTTKEFKLILEKVKSVIDTNALLFSFDKDDKELKKFIKDNFIADKFPLTKTQIDKNNFMIIYNKWLQAVKPTICVNWEIAKDNGIIDGDFYLADLLSRENFTLKDKLFVLLKKEHYELNREIKKSGLFSYDTTGFNDEQIAHTQFWNKYQRPPKEEYWDYIVERRDLLVPQDVRERKGSFFTPQIWVELSQKYLTDVLGEDWQDDYYIWDCAAGTGNLLAGLTNKYNIWASTLDKQDVDVMHDRINNGANLLHDHVFQFDFLNDDFSKLPEPLQDIINDPEKRKKLVVYINPPYAEAASTKTVTGTAENKTNVSNTSSIYNKYSNEMGKSCRELFALFLMRIYKEIPNAKIANFSKLKLHQATNFELFRNIFLSELKNMFIVPAYTFDNVSGKFPIGFFIWDTNSKEIITNFASDVFDEKGIFLFQKEIKVQKKAKTINDWLKNYIRHDEEIATMCCIGADFQHQNYVNINFRDQLKGVGNAKGIAKFGITKSNLQIASIYYSVRKCINANWINDRDIFRFPNEQWDDDPDFKSDCLVYALFNIGIQSSFGVNHWIPFTEEEVNSHEKFESNFMSDFIKGKIKPKTENNMFSSK